MDEPGSPVRALFATLASCKIHFILLFSDPIQKHSNSPQTCFTHALGLVSVMLVLILILRFGLGVIFARICKFATYMSLLQNGFHIMGVKGENSLNVFIKQTNKTMDDRFVTIGGANLNPLGSIGPTIIG